MAANYLDDDEEDLPIHHLDPAGRASVRQAFHDKPEDDEAAQAAQAKKPSLLDIFRAKFMGGR